MMLKLKLIEKEKSPKIEIGKARPLVEMRNIVKKFYRVVANDGISLSIYPGQIHALLGENGAGKSTLMNILYGIYRPDEGEIYVSGRKVSIKSPKDAMRLGIGMVHQHPRLVEALSVAENISLSLTDVGVFASPRVIKPRIMELARKYGMKVNPDAKIWQLSYSERQRVELLRVLMQNAKVLILDEPTTMLTSSEKKELFSMLRKMASEGKAVIFITHKLEEALSVSDIITVLRKGRVAAQVAPEEVTVEELARLMLGYEMISTVKREPHRYDGVVLKVENLHVLGDAGVPMVKGVSFEVRQGEIFTICGVAGNGQRELVEAITGLRKVARGKVFFLGRDVTNTSPRLLADMGVAHIPEDRIHVGIVPDMSVAENLALKKYRSPEFSTRFTVMYDKIYEWARSLIKQYSIIAPSEKIPAKHLSGGNIQRLILAREFSGEPRLMVAVNPTYGLDVAATNFILSKLLEAKKRGVAVLMISEDLEQALKVSDKIAVMYEGQLKGIFPVEEADIREIELMMVGVK